jgi:hypothetical protein
MRCETNELGFEERKKFLQQFFGMNIKRMKVYKV